MRVFNLIYYVIVTVIRLTTRCSNLDYIFVENCHTPLESCLQDNFEENCAGYFSTFFKLIKGSVDLSRHYSQAPSISVLFERFVVNRRYLGGAKLLEHAQSRG